MRIMLENNRREVGKHLLILLGSAIITAIALNEFLVPGKIFSAGINGISQIIATLLAAVGIHQALGGSSYSLTSPLVCWAGSRSAGASLFIPLHCDSDFGASHRDSGQQYFK